MFAVVISFLISGIFLYLSQLVSCSFIIGSWHSYFSVANISIPVFVAHFNIVYALFYYLAKALFAQNGLLFFVKKTSLLLSGVAYKKDSFVFSIVLPAVCMGFFMGHSLGSQVFWYSFFWLIPMALYFVPQKNNFISALSSTFLAHAIGSVVWLYVYQLEPHYFFVAAPFVLFERVTLAIGIVSLDVAVTHVKQWAVRAWQYCAGVMI